MRQILLLLITLIIGGCAHSGIDLKPKEKLSTQSYSIVITGEGWWTGQKPEARMLKFQGISDRLWFNRNIPNMMSEDVDITVATVPAGEQGMSNLLNNKHDLEKSLQDPPTEWEKKNLTERGVGYRKRYVDYISGLKCSTNVESSNVALGVGNKEYGTYCAYYDVNGGRKEIDISYRYTYTHSGTKHEDDTQSSTVTPEAMQQQFKQDMKAIFDSLVIHDMDKTRMSKEGLLHDKKYEIQEW